MKKIKFLTLVLLFCVIFGGIPITSTNFQEQNVNIQKQDVYYPDAQDTEIQYQVIQITDNNYEDNLGQIDDGLAVWQADIHEDGKNEIFLYNVFSCETTQITDNDYDDRLPEIDDGIITWMGAIDGNYDIFVYESGIITQITHTTYNEMYPRIDDGIITWYGAAGNYEIYMYDCSSKEITQITNNAFTDYYPQVDSGLITWFGWSGPSTDIFLYDTSSKTTKQITNDEYPDDFPIIDDSIIVWRKVVQRTPVPIVYLCLYDFNSDETMFIADLGASYGYSIDDGNITYKAREILPDGTRLDTELYFCNYPTLEIKQITYDDNEENTPWIEDGLIVWYVQSHVFLYNIETGITITIAKTTYSTGTCYIHDGILMWADRSGDNEIFIAKHSWIEATFRISPNTLNLKCKGNWVTGFIELSDEYNVMDIDILTIRLLGSIPAQFSPTSIGDINNNGKLDLMLKFDRASLQDLVSVGDAVEISISGYLKNGIMFYGSDFIKVIDQGNDHVNEDDPSSIV